MNPVCTMNSVCTQSSAVANRSTTPTTRDTKAIRSSTPDDFSDALQQQLTVEPLDQPLGRSRAARCLRGSADGTGLIHDAERPDTGAERMRQDAARVPATALRLVD